MLRHCFRALALSGVLIATFIGTSAAVAEPPLAAAAPATSAEVKKIIDDGVAKTVAATPPATAAEVKKVVDEGLIKTAAANKAHTDEVNAAIKRGVTDAAVAGANSALDTLKARLAMQPISATCNGVPLFDPRRSAQDIEQRAAQALKCCPDPPTVVAPLQESPPIVPLTEARKALRQSETSKSVTETVEDTYASMMCIHDVVQVLAYAHDRQARNRQKWYFGETDASATGAAALVIGGSKAAASTTVAWSVIALAPVIIEDITAQGPRSQVAYAASHAFARLDEHYRVLDRRLRALSKLEVENRALITACRNLKILKDIAAKDDGISATVLNNEVAGFKGYCADFAAAATAYRPYGQAMITAYRDLPDRFAEDAEALEGLFHKISFSLQAPPSKALAITLAAPLDALSNAIRSGKTMADYKAREATFDLEKDGFPLSPSWPALPGPDKILPTAAASVSPSGEEAIKRLKANTDPKVVVEAGTIENRLNDVKTASEDTQLAITDKTANDVVTAIQNGAGTYKMVFDLRSQKRTVDIEFTKVDAKK